MKKIDFRRILQENLTEGCFWAITSSEKDFADWVKKAEKQFASYNNVFTELKKYRNLDKQKRLIKLPCPIGTLVFKLSPYCTMCDAWEDEKACENCKKGSVVVEAKFDYELIPLVNNTVFLTKEEAEAKLKEWEVRASNEKK